MATATLTPDASTRAEPRGGVQPVPPRAWNVVLLDDDDHTYEYVIEMMEKVFRAAPSRALEIARTVDSAGRAVCLTTHREHAELKREQILSFGADPRLARSAGAMSAVIEPASADDDPSQRGEGASRA